jgi:hypothetical protein
MAWIRFLKDDRRRVRPKPTGIVTSVIDYRAGMVENVPKTYAEDAIARGVAEATDAPNREGNASAETSPSGSSDSAAVHTRSRRRRSR